MNDPEKTQPLLAQEANEETFQVFPGMFQEHFLILDEEQLEEVTGGGCCFSSLAKDVVKDVKSKEIVVDMTPPHPPNENTKVTDPVTGKKTLFGSSSHRW